MAISTMRVMITGAHGQVGQSLTKQLSNEVEILAVDRAELDITDQSAVISAVEAFKPNFIINAAAHTAVDKAETEIELSYAINLDGPKYLAIAAESVNAALLHISTDYVFAGDKDGQYLETDSPNPQSVYGKSKLSGEIAVADHCSKHIILRTAWVFGEHGNNFVKTMLRLGKERDSLGIVNDQFGGPTYAGDIAATLISIAKNIHSNQMINGEDLKYGVYHFSGFPHVSWYQFAEEIFLQAQQQGIITNIPTVNAIGTDGYPTPAKRPVNSKLDTTKITTAFGVQPSDWKAAISQLTNYL